MNFKAKLFIAGLSLFFVCISIDVYPQFYVGASIGSSFVNKELTDLSGSDFKIDKNSFGYKIFAGYGKKFFGAEGGFRDLGKVKDESGLVNLSTKITGWDIAARGRVSLGPVLAFAKAGAFFAKSKNAIGIIEDTENSTNFLWGVGAGLKLGLIGIRLEYESLDLRSDSKLSMLTLGGTLHFGGK